MLNTLTAKIMGSGLAWVGGMCYLSANRLMNYSGDSVVLGIYEDYMSPRMSEHIEDHYGIKLDYFAHDQIVKDRFRAGVYDMAVVSTSILEELIHEDLVQQVDWSKLQLKKSDKDPYTISDHAGAKDLFTDVVQKIVDKSQENKKFLQYGIPYFMNKLSFCYRGDENQQLKNSGLKWSQVLDEIAKDSRFKSQGGKPKLGLIEDPRTVLSLSRFVGGETSVNITPTYSGADAIFGEYQKLLNKVNSGNMGRHFLYLEGISSQLVDSLVSGSISGAIMYNADCLYASYGGNLGTAHRPDSNKLHIVDISDDIYFLDFLVLSKKTNAQKSGKVHDFYRSILMDGHKEDKSKILDKEEPKNQVRQMSDGDDEADYKYWLTRNFDYVRYTPVVKNLDDGVKESYFEGDNGHRDYRKKAAKIEFVNGAADIKNHYESYFTAKVKSDMLMAFSRLKERL